MCRSASSIEIIQERIAPSQNLMHRWSIGPMDSIDQRNLLLIKIKKVWPHFIPEEVTYEYKQIDARCAPRSQRTYNNGAVVDHDIYHISKALVRENSHSTRQGEAALPTICIELDSTRKGGVEIKTRCRTDMLVQQG
jgi:hypothetical protein